MGETDWIQLAKDGDKLRKILNMVMSIQVIMIFWIILVDFVSYGAMRLLIQRGEFLSACSFVLPASSRMRCVAYVTSADIQVI